MYVLGPGDGPRPYGGDDTSRDAFDEAVRTQRDLSIEQLLEEADRLGPDARFADLDDDTVVDELAISASTVAAATARYLALVAELVTRRVWADQGARTPAEWLSWKLSVAPSTAREQLRVALRLRTLPQVAARLAAGTLSYSKVRAITRLATAADEQLLLDWADHGTAADLERISSATRGAQRRATQELQPDEDAAHRWQLRTHHDGTGTLTITAPIEDLAALEDQVLRLAQVVVADRECTDADDRPAGDGGARDQTRSEAAGGGTQTEEDEGPPPPRVRVADRIEALCHAVTDAAVRDTPLDTSGLDAHTMVMQVDAHDLAGGDGVDDGPAAIVAARDRHLRVTAMHRGVLRRLACEAGLVLATTGADDGVLDVGRRTRRPSARLRRAVHLRDRTCRFPGCHATRHLHVHHVQHWSDGGPTDLANLVLLCSAHHRHVHAHDVDIEVAADGQHTFRDARHEPIADVVHLPGAGALPRRPAADSAEALTPPGYVGDRLDLDTAVAVLMHRYAAVTDLDRAA